jgi:hypothetical protein
MPRLRHRKGAQINTIFRGILFGAALLLFSCPPPGQQDDGAKIPGTPTIFTVSGLAVDHIILKWDFTQNANEYIVYSDSTPSGAFSREAYRGALTECEDPGLIPETDYYYKLVAANSFGASPPSEALHAKTPGHSPDIPGALGAAGTNLTSINISWAAVNHASGYRLLRDTSPDGVFSTAIYEGSGISYRDADVSVGAVFYYKLQAINQFGSAISASALAASPIAPVPTPARVDSTGKRSIAISWTAPSGVSAFRVYRLVFPAGNPGQGYQGAATSFLDAGLISDTSYEYRICALNPLGQESDPALAGATTGLLTIQDVRDPAASDHPALGEQVTVSDLYVSGLHYGPTGAQKGIFVQANSTAPYSGIYVFLGNNSASTFAIGNRVSVKGDYANYYGMEEITSPVVTLNDGVTALPFAPLVVADPSSVATGGSNAMKYQSMLLSVASVTVTVATSHPANGINEFTISGGLKVDSRLFGIGDYAVGKLFTTITGLLGFWLSENGLEPRGSGDLID